MHKFCVCILIFAVSSVLAAVEVLPSWNDSARKQAIVEFVQSVTKEKRRFRADF